MDFNKAFAANYQKETGKSVEIKQSHGGSGAQARAVIDGLQADVVTLALAYDIDAIAAKGLIAADWQKRLPQNASPYTSTIVFLVRKGNPKGIKDWDDLVKPGIARDHAQSEDLRRRALELSGRLGLCAEEIRLRRQGEGNSSAISTTMCRCWIPARAARPSPSSSAASATCCWPGRTRRFWRMSEFGKDKFEIVAPSVSILAEPPCRVVDTVADRNGTRAVAEAYLKYFYTGGAGDRRAQFLSPARSRDRARNTRTRSQGRTVHRRRRFRRLDQGAEGTFRRRRRVRPDLQELIRPSRRAGDIVSAAARDDAAHCRVSVSPWA